MHNVFVRELAIPEGSAVVYDSADRDMRRIALERLSEEDLASGGGAQLYLTINTKTPVRHRD
jgi:hypothetical protein